MSSTNNHPHALQLVGSAQKEMHGDEESGQLVSLYVGRHGRMVLDDPRVARSGAHVVTAVTIALLVGFVYLALRSPAPELPRVNEVCERLRRLR